MAKSEETPPAGTPRRLQLRWLNPNDAHERSRVSRVHEERIAKTLGGKRYPNSGARKHSKWRPMTAGGDIQTPKFHIEHKRTEHASLGVKYAWLERVVEEARVRSLDPALVLTFQNDGVRYDRPESQRVPADWMLLPVAVVQRMLAALEAQREVPSAPSDDV